MVLNTVVIKGTPSLRYLNGKLCFWLCLLHEWRVSTSTRQEGREELKCMRVCEQSNADYRHQIQKQEQRESEKQGQNCLVGKKGQWM
jgi:hypothetical protein